MNHTSEQKNWLIRTKSKQILGPISRQKLKEFYQNGSLDLDDEICSGNGFWFWLREEELVEKYLIAGEKQSFNPVSEAPSVLTSDSLSDVDEEHDFSDDLTLVGTNLKDLQLDEPTQTKADTEEENILFPTEDDLAYPEIGQTNFEDEDSDDEEQTDIFEATDEFIEHAEEIEDNVILEDALEEGTSPDLRENFVEEESEEENDDMVDEAKPRNDRYLLYLIFIIMLVLAGSFVFYRRVLKKPFPLLDIVSSAQAQELTSLVKKKT